MQYIARHEHIDLITQRMTVCEKYITPCDSSIAILTDSSSHRRMSVKKFFQACHDGNLVAVESILLERPSLFFTV